MLQTSVCCERVTEMMWRAKVGALVACWFCTGCGSVEQSGACATYVQCLSERDQALGVSTNALRFEAGGACWGSHEGAELCTTACERGLEFIAAAEASAPEVCSQ